ncbi:MAG: hypothetical protein HWE15_14945 [Algoriphagus sp.]|uniref:hypothetical protein n=1 Tax=Algoriphagus sp. TaxID=1872435 RepID=UPI001836FD1C|nr:hypothetical protein [Algoriphagus sp.]NVJ87598.1 hypothetical protein [Algoriphagus sp.]
MLFLFRRLRSSLLRKDKVWRYLAYAVGEIFLVVIGIYIAIQFNNWNEHKKQKAIVKTNIGILIKTLQEDTTYYQDRLFNIDRHLDILKGYQERLIQPSANKDTLIKIIREEFRAGIVKVDRDHRDAYNSMTMSGEINYFDKALREEIFGLYTQHSVLTEENNSHFFIYLDNLEVFSAKFGLTATSPFKSGPIAEAIWEDVDLRALAVAFQPLYNTKRNHLNQVKNEVILVLEKTNALLIELEQARDD